MSDLVIVDVRSRYRLQKRGHRSTDSVDDLRFALRYNQIAEMNVPAKSSNGFPGLCATAKNYGKDVEGRSFVVVTFLAS